MNNILSSRLRRGLQVVCCLLAVTFSAAPLAAQTLPSASGGRILLVLPFDNRSGQPSLEWVREAAAEILSARLASAGFAPMSRPDRLYALDHLGLPASFHPSRASSLKLAQTLDADFILVGSFKTDGSTFTAEAQLVDVPHLRLGETVTASSDLHTLAAVFDSLAWKLTRQLDPGFSVAEETFTAADRNLRIDAFEQYIRGIIESDHEERLRHLKQAVKLSPDLGAAWTALGREQYNGKQYDEAAQAFAHVGPKDADALEAGFERGLALLFQGDYPHAEESFAAVAQSLPLPQAVNNQGVAASRQHKDALALFRQAVAADSQFADYHFNLALALKHKNQTAAALEELAQCLRLHPADAEALALQTAWKSPAAAADPAQDPLERIVRSFDAAAFRQAEQMLNQTEAARLAALSPRDRALRQTAEAREFLDHGLLLEAERLLQAAVAEDDKLPEAHTGLALVRERAGDAVTARKEATTSLELMPSIDAYLVLARVDVAAKNWELARFAVASILQIDANNKAALELKQQIADALSETK